MHGRARTHIQALTRSDDTHPPTHTHTQSLILPAPPHLIHTVNVHRKGGADVRHRGAGRWRWRWGKRQRMMERWPPFTLVHAHFCLHAPNVAPVHIFVDHIQHGAVLQIEACAVELGLRRRGWKELEKNQNFSVTNL